MSEYDIGSDDSKETTRLIEDNAREMHRYDESHDFDDSVFAKYLVCRSSRSYLAQ